MSHINSLKSICHLVSKYDTKNIFTFEAENILRGDMDILEKSSMGITILIESSQE